MGRKARLGKLIVEMIKDKGEVNPFEVYKVWRNITPNANYNTVLTYFWALEKLGVLRKTQRKPSKGFFPKQYYTLNVDPDEIPEEWLSHPVKAYYRRFQL